MTTSTDLLIRDVKEEFKKSRSRVRVARALNISMEMVRQILDEDTPPISSKRQEIYGGAGRPDLTQYMVDTIHVTESWNNAKPSISAARAAYEAGTHEMCTGRDGDYLILYSIPRAVVTPRKGYFNLGVNIYND